MANNPMIIEERSRNLGQFLVGRLLPFRKKRQVGPFTFIDHIGPSDIGSGSYLDVDQHPHIGLSTLTYLIEGEIEHRDSTGAEEIITPGSVNFMTAGKGVSHTERTPKHLREGKSSKLHGYQVWVALPIEYETMDPIFQRIKKKDIPEWKDKNAQYRLVAGEGFGFKSPLQVYSPLFMVDIIASRNFELDIQDQLHGEVAVVVVKGEVQTKGNSVGSGKMLISKVKDTCPIEIKKGTQVLLFGGEPLTEERYLYWNFVSSNKVLIEEAKENWQERKFPKVPGDYSYIPLPGR